MLSCVWCGGGPAGRRGSWQKLQVQLGHPAGAPHAGSWLGGSPEGPPSAGGDPALPTQDGVRPRPRVTQQGSQGLDSRSLGLTLKSDCLFPLVVKEGQAESSGMGSRRGGPTGLGRFPLSLRRGA